MLAALILAGGKGTRLASRLNGLPKPLVNVAGQPLLARQLQALKEGEINKIYILVNHKAEQVEAYCKSYVTSDLEITCIDDGEPSGTAGAVLKSLSRLPPEIDDILIIYGDTLFNIDFKKMYEFYSAHPGAGCLFLHPNSHPQDSDLVGINAAGQITAFYPYPHPEDKDLANLVNAAFYILRRDTLGKWKSWLKPGILDFGKDLFPAMLQAGNILYAYRSPEYIKDVGTPARLDAAEADIKNGAYNLLTLQKKQKAVFLDRDGVINKENGFINNPEQLKLIPQAAAAIAKLNKSGYLVIVITNQPVIARGECDEEGLAKIHARLDTLLGKEGAYIDRLYYCPHHPDSGFAGERKELKIKCNCRKPEVGMILQSEKDLNLDLSKCWLIGDRSSDILTANRAHIKSILVKTGAAGRDGKYEAKPDYIAENLKEAVSIILD